MINSFVMEGKKAPNFKLFNQDGEAVSLADFKGKTVVLYFYPRADTPGCTVEACEFRDHNKEFGKGAAVLGVSPDQPAALKKFQKKFSLPFPLLSDPEHTTATAYGAWGEKSMYGKKYMGIVRTTFVIGPDGKIVKVFAKVKPKGHATEVLAALGK
jgi:peroxiredoxin Q/BCP